MPDGGICPWADDVKEIAAAFFVSLTEVLRKILEKLRPANVTSSSFVEMKDVPILEAGVADYQVQIIIPGFLDSIGKCGVIVNIDYAKNFVVLIAYCAGY